MTATRTTGRFRVLEEMSEMNGNHMKHMLFAGAGVFGVLLLVGVPLTSALLYAVALSCPLMMLTMGGHSGHGGAGGDPSSRSSDEPDKSTDRPHQHQHHV